MFANDKNAGGERRDTEMVRVKVRVFTFPSDPREQNSFLVGTSEVGAPSSVCCVIVRAWG